MNGQVYGQLTLFPEGSHASHSPLPGSSGARQTTATSGRKWLGLSKNSGQLGLLEKMLLGSLGWHSPIYYLNWKPVGIGQGHFLYQLALSEPDTEDTGLQLWATPNTMDYLPQRSKEALQKQAEGSRKGRKRPANLREQVNPETVKLWPTPKASMRGDCPSERKRKSPDLAAAVKMWPTPRARETGDYQYSKGEHSRKIPTLSGAVKMYNTPTAQDAKNSTLPASQIKRGSLVGDVMREQFATPQARDYRTGQADRWEDKGRSRNLNDQIAMYPTPTGARICGGSNAKKHLDKMQKAGNISETEKKSMQNGNGGRLNPDWVEWLMGFPAGWTETT